MKALINKIMYAGVEADEPYHTTIAKVTINTLLIGVFFLAIAWAFSARLLLDSDTLVFIHMSAIIASVLIHLAMQSGAVEHAKIATVCLLLFYFAFCNIYLGFRTGVEFYAAPLFFGVLIITPKEDNQTNLLLRIVTVAGILLTYLAMALSEPLLPMSQAVLQTGYSMTVASVTLVSIVLFEVYGKQTGHLLNALEQQNHKTQDILANVLPDVIAQRLQHDEKRIADAHGGAAVLFADIEGFTTLSRSVAPSQLVEMLDELFSEIDESASKCGVEKIKTIGDSYMAASGVLDTDSNPDNIIQFAIQLRDIVSSFSVRMGYPIRVRIGIGFGHVISGVIGKSKKSFDLWGETVNLASRMEATGVTGKIQVTESLYWRLKDRYAFERRCAVEVKGYGKLNTYFLSEDNTPDSVPIQNIKTPLQEGAG